jgi:hypothetical protein
MNGRALAIVLKVLGCAMAVQLLLRPPSFMDIDFPVWRTDWGKFTCMVNGSGACPPLTKFPVAYLFMAMLTSWTQSDLARQLTLFTLNAAYLLAPPVFFRAIHGAEQGRRLSRIYGKALFFSALPAFYFYSGALEIQAGVVLGLATSALVLTLHGGMRKKSLYAVLFLCAFLAPLYKDTNFLSLGIVVLACAGAGAVHAGSARRFAGWLAGQGAALWSVASGLALAAGLAVAYNYLRYRSVLPIEYIQEGLGAAPPATVSAVYAIAQVLSPNGGLVAAWALSAFIVSAGLRRAQLRPSRFGLAIAGMVVVLSVLVLARWWTPFGWEGWGNRLIVPSVMCALITVLATVPIARQGGSSSADGGAELPRAGSFPRSRVAAGMIGILVVASAYYVLSSYSYRRMSYLDASMWGSESCRRMAVLREKDQSWAFKRTDVHMRCHYDRFLYVPGS